VNLIKGSFQHLIEVIPIGPIADHQKIPVEQTHFEPLGAALYAIRYGRDLYLSGGPDHVVGIARPASMQFEVRRLLRRQTSATGSVDPDGDLAEEHLPGGFDEIVDIGRNARLNCAGKKKIGDRLMASIRLARESVEINESA
jgi:hypothetical protein